MKRFLSDLLFFAWVLALLWLVVLVPQLVSADRQKPTLAGLDSITSAHEIRIRNLEAELQKLKAGSAAPGRITRYCIDTYAGIMECNDCRIMEKEWEQ